MHTERNDKIGKVDDFVVPADGKLTTTIIDVGGFLGVASHRVAIPLSQLSEIRPGASCSRARVTTSSKSCRSSYLQYV